jgi:uncharacterized protein (DUF952 family)
VAATIFHITSRDQAVAAGGHGEYVPEGFAREGFIHCSYPHQLIAVANRLFRGRTDLVVMEIDPSRLTCPIVDENLEGGSERYPHVYGRLPMSGVVAIRPLPCGIDGRFA